MKYFSLFLIFLVGLCACTAENKENSQTIIYSDYSQFPNLPTVEIFINEQGPFTFFIDTGSFASGISESLAEELGLAHTEPRTQRTRHINKTYDLAVTPMAKINFPNTEIERTTHLLIIDNARIGSHGRGIIGLSELRNGYIRNRPDDQRLEITLINSSYECDMFKTSSVCSPKSLYRPSLPAVLGGESMLIFLDTGYMREKSLIVFKSPLNNAIWQKYGHFSASDNIAIISDKPVKALKTKDFIFNGNATCYADFIIRDPNDSSGYYKQSGANMGWNVIRKAAFEIDFTEGKTIYPQHHCPYEKMNRLGIWRFSITEDQEEAMISFVEINSPAHRAGLQDGDMIQRIYLDDGTVIEKFGASFSNASEKHVFAPDGTRLIFDFTRNGEAMSTEAITHKPLFVPMNFDE